MPKGDNQVHERKVPTLKKKDRLRLEIQIIKELGHVPSIRQMQELLFDRTGHKYSTSIIHSDLQALDKVTVEQFEAEKNDLLAKLDAEISIAHKIATDRSEDNKVRLQAMKVMTSLAKAKSDLLEAVGRITAERQKKIIQYNIFLGKPEKVDLDEIKKNLEKIKRQDVVDTSNKSQETSN